MLSFLLAIATVVAHNVTVGMQFLTIDKIDTANSKLGFTVWQREKWMNPNDADSSITDQRFVAKTDLDWAPKDDITVWNKAAGEKCTKTSYQVSPEGKVFHSKLCNYTTVCTFGNRWPFKKETCKLDIATWYNLEPNLNWVYDPEEWDFNLGGMEEIQSEINIIAEESTGSLKEYVDSQGQKSSILTVDLVLSQDAYVAWADYILGVNMMNLLAMFATCYVIYTAKPVFPMLLLYCFVAIGLGKQVDMIVGVFTGKFLIKSYVEGCFLWHLVFFVFILTDFVYMSNKSENPNSGKFKISAIMTMVLVILCCAYLEVFHFIFLGLSCFKSPTPIVVLLLMVLCQCAAVITLVTIARENHHEDDDATI